jgi:hypothetical protein
LPIPTVPVTNPTRIAESLCALSAKTLELPVGTV